jgi:hypothetical protein
VLKDLWELAQAFPERVLAGGDFRVPDCSRRILLLAAYPGGGRFYPTDSRRSDLAAGTLVFMARSGPPRAG